MSKPKVLYVPTEGHTQRVFREATFARMCEEFEVTVNDTGAELDTDEVARWVAGCDGLVTGWGSRALAEEVFVNAPDLKIIAHSAGSVRFLVTREMIDRYLLPRGVVLFSANVAIARNVAESAIGMLIMASRRWIDHNAHYHQTGRWRSPDIPVNGQYLRGCKLGLISASAVAREVIRLLQGWDIEFLVYDPYLSDEAAARLGVRKVELNQLFEEADHVSVHAPKLPETDNLIGREQLRRLRDGAAFVNTARGSVIDEQALIEEAQTGRIQVALDVTEPEPPAPDHPFQHLPNVIISPHTAGAGHFGYLQIGETTLQALRDAFAGRPVTGAAPLDRWEQLA
ncbi:MAG: hydroxyacid dehydrogenase [Armatimonadetes bacterium]|nr:hydroxyacid dehydrogenase [Armatimonadota bacterium]